MRKCFSPIRSGLDAYGLSIPWQNYLLILLTQAIVSLSIIFYHHGSSRSGILMHLILIIIFVISANLFTNIFKHFSYIKKYIFPIFLGLFQLFLLCLYIAAFIGYSYVGAIPNLGLVLSYINNLDYLFDSIGLSYSLFMAITFLLVSVSILWSVLLFKTKPQTIQKQKWQWLVMVIFAISYVSTKEFWHHREILHIIYFDQSLRTAPLGMLKPGRQETTYSSTKPNQIEPRPLVLITVDALRSDAMHVYGNTIANTPFLSSLFKRGELQRFNDTKSICPNTYCGLTGTLSSRYWSQLDVTPDNLPDALNQYGYQSHFLLSGDHKNYFKLSLQYGDNIFTYRDGGTELNDYVDDDRPVEGWLAELNPTKPEKSFLFIHLKSVHQSGLRLEEFQAQVPSIIGAEQTRETLYIQRYHDGVLQADNSIRKIFSLLEKKNWLNNALIIITADHGEYLGEFNRHGHGGIPFEPVINIPLLVYDQHNKFYPKRAIYSQVDVAPTFLHAINARIPMNWSGIPLQKTTSRCAVEISSFYADGVVGVVNDVPFKYLEINSNSYGRIISMQEGRYLYDLRVTEEGVLSIPDGFGDIELINQLKNCTKVR
jgi:glucan phosphoethanolaminetransferase (alkaline phosphatase superfamily)